MDKNEDNKNENLTPQDIPHRAHILLKYEYGSIKENKARIEYPMTSKIYVLEANSKEEIQTKLDTIRCFLTNLCKIDSLEGN